MPHKLRFILILPTLVMAATALGKIVKAPPLVANFEKLDAVAYMVPLGVVQLTSTLLFIIPKTRRIGFFLLCSYIGGIIATRLLSPEPLGPGLVIGSLLWIGMYFEDPDLFSRQPRGHEHTSTSETGT